MIPRRDPDTRPHARPMQIIMRGEWDDYGNEQTRAARRARKMRPVEIRNGMPAPRYAYQGTGESMSETEAAYWLRMNVAPGFPLNPRPGATLPKGSPPQ
jgi:hypothetical protein